MRPGGLRGWVVLLHLGLALGLCAVPLASDLGLERAILTGLLSTITAPLVARSYARQRPGEGPLAAFGRASLLNLGLLGLAAAAGLAVEARAVVCNPPEGVGFLLLIAGGNACLGGALGVLLAPLPRGRFAAALLLVWGGSLAAILSRLYTQPQIFVYSAVWGFWPGSIYDEAVPLDARLVGLRAFTLALSAALLALRSLADAIAARQPAAAGDGARGAETEPPAPASQPAPAPSPQDRLLQPADHPEAEAVSEPQPNPPSAPTGPAPAPKHAPQSRLPQSNDLPTATPGDEPPPPAPESAPQSRLPQSDGRPRSVPGGEPRPNPPSAPTGTTPAPKLATESAPQSRLPQSDNLPTATLGGEPPPSAPTGPTLASQPAPESAPKSSLPQSDDHPRAPLGGEPRPNPPSAPTGPAPASQPALSSTQPTQARLRPTGVGGRARDREARGGAHITRRAALVGGLLALTGLTWLSGPRLGWRLDRGDVQASLSTQLSSANFVLHLDPAIPDQAAQSMLHAVDRRHRQLRRLFSRPLGGKIHVYVYRDAAEKGRLMGGARTQLARPWQREIHIHGSRLPHPVLKHELAHILAGAYAAPPLRVPARAGLLPKMSLVEGLAVAADWPERGLTPHDWSQAMLGLDILPPVGRLMSPQGFWAAASNRAYTAAGSFLRYLIDLYGPQPVLQAYELGDFRAAFGQPLPTLLRGWRRFLQERAADPHALARARLRFRRPSLFSRSCPHEAARLQARAYGRLEAGDLPGAVQGFAALGRYQRGDPGPHLALARAYLDRGLLDPAADQLTKAAKLPSGPRLRSLQARLQFRRRDWAAARGPLIELLRGPYVDGWRRWAAVRLLALDRPAPRRDAILTGPRPTQAQLATEHPEDGLLGYLRGMQLRDEGQQRPAATQLSSAARALRAEAQRQPEATAEAALLLMAAAEDAANQARAAAARKPQQDPHPAP